MNRYLAGLVGLFCFSFSGLVGCAAEPAGDDAEGTEAVAVSAAAAPEATAAVAYANAKGVRVSSDLACITGKYASTSSWTSLEILPEGKGIRTEVLHDGKHARFAQSVIRWSEYDRSIMIGATVERLRVEPECRVIWIGDVKFARVD